MFADPHERIVCSVHNTGRRDSIKFKGFCIDCLYDFARLSGEGSHDLSATADYLTSLGKTQENLEMAVKGKK